MFNLVRTTAKLSLAKERIGEHQLSFAVSWDGTVSPTATNRTCSRGNKVIGKHGLEA